MGFGAILQKKKSCNQKQLQEKKPTKKQKGDGEKKREEHGKDESKLNVISVRDDVSDLLFFKVFPSAMVPKVTESSFPCVP